MADLNEEMTQWAFGQKTGGYKQKLVLVVLAMHADDFGQALMSKRDLGRITQLRKRALRATLNLLCHHGFLHEIEGGWQICDPGVAVGKGDKLSISATVRAEVYERDGNACVRCGRPNQLTIDHITPQSRGGTHAKGNLQTLCGPCNVEKGDRTNEEWLGAPN